MPPRRTPIRIDPAPGTLTWPGRAPPSPTTISEAAPEQITAFITRWQTSGAAERANYQMFLSELCDIIGVPRPDPTSPDPAKNLYVFDRAITRTHLDGTTTTNYIDLYKAGHFVNETKQGLSADATPDELAKPTATKTGHGKRGTLAFDKALERAYHQARGYITALPADEGRPPFLIVCDVGHTIDLYAEFTGTGGQYERFPDPVSHRITLPDLHRPEIRERLRKVWLDPHSLDPSKFAAQVTRDIAGRLATLAKSLEADGHDPQVIAGFLQRSLFTMFAEDIGLLPDDGFKTLLEKVKDTPRGFPVLVSGLWKEMATGTQYSALLFKEIAHFNGGLFENTSALPLSAAQLAMLTDAAATDWSAVEPSIFGTLLTRALDSRERHKLGAEYTPRSYVERLIRPTIIGPLRDEWDAVRVAAATLHEEADQIEIQADQLQAEGDAQLAAGASAKAKESGAESTRPRRAEWPQADFIVGNLQVGADVSAALSLKANERLASQGANPLGLGFRLTSKDLRKFGLDPNSDIPYCPKYAIGRDLVQKWEDKWVVDFSGLAEEQAASECPILYQHILIHVKPERSENNRATRRENWWLFGENAPMFRASSRGLVRYIATCRTAKHRLFTFLAAKTIPDAKIVAIAADDSFCLSILSSFIHTLWALRTGAFLEDRPNYNHADCFNKFPFPALEEGALKQRIRDLGERLDAHRKREQAQHPGLTLTGIYNVLEKLRTGESLNAKDRETHDQGLISVLKQIHDDLDSAVLEAYGWTGLASATPPADILAHGGPAAEALEQELLTRLVALNHERAAEEKRGLIRYLRPDYQAPGAASAPAVEQSEINLPADGEPTPAIAIALAWPETMADQVVAVRKLLPTVGHDTETLGACFGRKNKKRGDQIAAILATLKALGHI